MKYEKQILEGFDRIGFKPRDDQVQQIDQILIAFLDEKYKNVVLSAPTGTGKSIIGAVVAEVIHEIKHPYDFAGASFMLNATNALATQYADTFVREEKEDNRFHMIIGAVNYECSALSTPEEPQTAESCSIILFKKSRMEEAIERYCSTCEYQLSRERKKTARHIITNYSYYFLDRLFSTHKMPERTVCIFDEVHLLNDLFVEHNAIYFSEKRLKSFVDEASEALKLGNTTVFKNLKNTREHLIAGKITEKNYKTYLRTLLNTYTAISKSAEEKAKQSIRAPSTYLKLLKLSKKYYNLGCKIDDLFRFDYPHVFEYKAPDKNQKEHEINIKPIFIGKMFEELDNAEHNLLMSATVSEQYVKRTMNLPGTTKHIRLPPQFPPENKKVVFFKPQALNFTSMKQPETVKTLCASVLEIVTHHTKLGERGLILAPSFVIVQAVAETLRKAGGNYTLFEHRQGEKLADWIEEFKEYTEGKSAVLLTPSGFEGLDLPGDLSRFQIIVKCPWGSLGDKRTAYILEHHPAVYSEAALMKVTQGAGRSVRSKEDYATTYCLDIGIQRLWTAKNNEWHNEFSTSFTSFLEKNND